MKSHRATPPLRRSLLATLRRSPRFRSCIAAWCLAALASSSWATPAQTALVSNLGNAVTDALVVSYDAGIGFISPPSVVSRANSFTTGASATVLESIVLAMGRLTTNQPNGGFAVSLYSGNNTSGPGSLLSTLSGNANPSTAANYTYTPGSALTLAAATTYFVVASVPDSTETVYFWNYTTNAAETGTAGWSIGDQNWTSISSDNNGAWEKSSLLPVLSLQFSVNGAPLIPAATHWKGQTNTNWSGANWASDASGTATTAIPTTATNLTFSATGAASAASTVLDQDFTIAGLTVNNVVGITGTKTLAINGTIDVLAGGALTINAGVRVTATLNTDIKALGAANTAAVTVTGANAKLEVGNRLGVGIGGGVTGTLNVLEGGAVTSAELKVGTSSKAIGTATINGPGSTLSTGPTFIGAFEGNGTLNIEAGGVVKTKGSAVVGQDVKSVGLVKVTGAGSKWEITKDLTIDKDGDGTLNILDGGEVSNGNGIIATGLAAALKGTVTVDGSGSKWTNSGSVTVGDTGPGILNLKNGGVANVGDGTGVVTLGAQGKSTGTLNIGSFGGSDAAGTLNAAEVKGGLGTAVLNFNHADASYTFAPKISGSTKVDQNGLGKTILNTANTYTGGTNINAGTLQTGNASALGNGPVTLNAGTLRAVGTLNLGSLTWKGGLIALEPLVGDVINVKGDFINDGGGTFAIGPQDLVLNKAYDLVTFDSTTFTLDQFKVVSTNANVQLNSSFILNKGDVQIIVKNATASSLPLHNTQNGVPTFADYTASGNVISGLTASGFQELQTYIQNLFVPNSTLIVPGPNILNVTGYASINGSTVTVNGTMNVGGNFSDPNSVINVSGLLNVAGNTTIEGNSTVNVNPGGIFLTGGNSTFNDSTANIAGTYRTGGDFHSTGSRLNVSGLLIVDRIAELNAGTVLDISSGGRVEVGTGTFIHGGARAIVNGVLQSPVVSVLHGGRLQGNGLVIGNVLNRGTVAPGNSIGTLTIDGNYTQFHNGTLQIELSGGRSDLLVVSGTARLAGTLDVRRLGGKLAYGDQHTFLQAGRIIGEFDRIRMPQPGTYRGRFLTEGGTGILLVAPTSYTLVAQTANQRRLARALDKWIGMEEGDIGEVTLALDVQTEEQYPAAFDAISPRLLQRAAAREH